MNKTIDYQGKKVHYSLIGDGDTLLFLHGYLESSEIWREFTERFSESYKVICVDLPGHGKSEIVAQVHYMSLMADVVNKIVEEENIERLIVFGHSMGGYVCMEYVDRFPEKVRAYCLFHSSCFADDEEKKLNRDREISLVKCGKKMQIIHTNIPKAFAEGNLKKLEDEVVRAKIIASQSPDEGIVALLRGMKERKDHSKRLMDLSIEPLLIWGMKDNYIGEGAFKKLVALAPHASVIVLKDSGHMGFIEEPECVYTGIADFLEKIK